MKSLHRTLIVIAGMGAASAFSGPLFYDSFESEDLSANHVDGLNWHGTNRTSLVTRYSDQGDTVVFNGSPVEISVGFTRDWLARDGDIALRFRYPAGEYQSEQRFSFDSAHEELWIRYWLRVPVNFKHSSRSPSNNKLFAMWMDDYSSKGAGPTVAWEFWDDGSGGSRVAFHYSPGGKQVMGGHQQHTAFIDYPEDQGRWMQVAVQLKAASSRGANDGVIRFYRRWEDESSFSLLHSDTDADIAAPSGGPDGWKAGYFMGWSNPGYDEDTEWLMDNVEFSTSSLIDDSEPVDPPVDDDPDGPSDPDDGPDDKDDPEAPADCKPSQEPEVVGWKQ